MGALSLFSNHQATPPQGVTIVKNKYANPRDSSLSKDRIPSDVKMLIKAFNETVLEGEILQWPEGPMSLVVKECVCH